MKVGMRVVAVVGLAAFCMAGCETDKATTQAMMDSDTVALGAVNPVCPMTGEAIDSASTVEYNGYTVGFCCDGCVGAWDKMSDSDRMAFIDKYSK